MKLGKINYFAYPGYYHIKNGFFYYIQIYLINTKVANCANYAF